MVAKATQSDVRQLNRHIALNRVAREKVVKFARKQASLHAGTASFVFSLAQQLGLMESLKVHIRHHSSLPPVDTPADTITIRACCAASQSSECFLRQYDVLCTLWRHDRDSEDVFRVEAVLNAEQPFPTGCLVLFKCFDLYSSTGVHVSC